MDGTLHTVDGRPMLRFERRLSHPVTKVWRAITDPAELSGWFPWRVELDLRIGGKISFTHPKGIATAPDAVITELDPPHVFGYHWNVDDLRWALTADGDECVLVFTHTFAERPAAAKFAAGWQVSLDALAGAPVSADGWQVAHDRYVRAFGLLDGEINGDELKFEQEIVHPAEVVWAALLESVVPAGARLRPLESIAFPSEDGAVRILLAPQDFGTRVVVTVTASDIERLPAARASWAARLASLAAALPVRG